MEIRKSVLLPPFTEAGVILAVFACIALIVVPRVRLVLAAAQEGPPLPAMTQMIFRISPGGIIVVALVLGIAAGMGRWRSGSPWILRSAMILTVLFGAMIAVGLSIPFVQQ